jgi:protease I
MVKALIISADEFEDSELLVPLFWLQENGIKVEIVSIAKGIIKGSRGYEAEAAKSLDEVIPSDYSILLLPGGIAAEAVRIWRKALDISRYFFEKNKLIAAACQGSDTLISAGLLKGRHATCDNSTAIAMKECGAYYENDEVVVDGNLITCRRPGDMAAFSRAIISMIQTRKWPYTIEDVPQPCSN